MIIILSCTVCRDTLILASQANIAFIKFLFASFLEIVPRVSRRDFGLAKLVLDLCPQIQNLHEHSNDIRALISCVTFLLYYVKGYIINVYHFILKE